jgi:hypothetical protein
LIDNGAEVASIIAILFVVTLVIVSGYFILRVLGARFRGKPGATFQEKARAAFQAADLGWLALFCGPCLGLCITLLILLKSLTDGDFKPSSVARMIFMITTVGAIAGGILAAAFWVSSLLLGKVRKATKRLRLMYDPAFDGP